MSQEQIYFGYFEKNALGKRAFGIKWQRPSRLCLLYDFPFSWGEVKTKKELDLFELIPVRADTVKI
jgi:hypothetical protein